MEIPTNLKRLYRHWDRHVLARPQLLPAELFKEEELFGEMEWFIKERMDIWTKKVSGETPPYTEDPILSAYRFCNIFREFDRQTIEFHTLLNPLRDDFPRWLLNMFYCRMVARPETVRIAGLLSFDEKENEMLYARMMASPRPRFGTPYVFPISAIQKSATPTRELFITQHLPRVMKEASREILGWEKLSVYDGVGKVLVNFGANLPFLWTEVLIDTAYQFPSHIDLFDSFPVGPGALPTFDRIDRKKRPELLAKELAFLAIDSDITYEGAPVCLSAENWEGIACEFRKYTNLKEGKGRRRLYHPHARS